MNTAQETWGDAGAYDFRILAGRLWVRRGWIAVSVLFFAAAFTALALLSTPVYRSSALLIPASPERSSLSGSLNSALGQIGGLASLAGVSVGNSDSATEEALAVMRSREFTDNFIDELHLMPILYASKWDKVSGNWNVSGTKVPTPAKAFKYFDTRVRTVAQDKKTGLVTLQVDWKDRSVAADWTNELVRRLNKEMRARAIAKADDSIGFLERELPTTSVVETREAINRLIETQVKQRMLANVTEEYAFRVIDKAVPADRDDPVRPRKLMLLIAGPFVGLAIGIAAVIIGGALFGPLRR